MQNDTLAWTALAACGGIGLFLLAVIRWVVSIARQTAITETDASSAKAISATALAKAEVLGTEFHNYRVEIAEKVATIDAKAEATMQTVVAAENRFAKAIEDLGDRFDKFTERLDRVLERGYFGESGSSAR